MNTADIIKKRREELGLSQEELAEKLGYKSRSSINKIELGLSDIPFAKIPSFAKALDIKPEVLMGWEDETVKLRNKVAHGIKLTKKEKLNFLKQLIEKMIDENFTEEQMKSLLEIKDFYRLVWELQFDEELIEKTKTNKKLFKILSDINVKTAKYHFKKEGLSFDQEDEQIHRESFELAVNKDYSNFVKKDIEGKSQPLKEKSNVIFLGDDSTFIYIPLYESISAGYGSEESEFIEMIPLYGLRKNGNDYFAVKVRGYSMEPKISDSSIIIIKKDVTIENGEIGAFYLNGETFVKQKRIGNGKIILHSFNNAFSDIVINEYDDFKEYGKVVGDYNLY